jgi:hypothetical protein
MDTPQGTGPALLHRGQENSGMSLSDNQTGMNGFIWLCKPDLPCNRCFCRNGFGACLNPERCCSVRGTRIPQGLYCMNQRLLAPSSSYRDPTTDPAAAEKGNERLQECGGRTDIKRIFPLPVPLLPGSGGRVPCQCRETPPARVILPEPLPLPPRPGRGTSLPGML